MAGDDRNNVNELLLQTAEGDVHAFTSLFDIFWPGVYAHILSFLKQAALSEEVSQDIFVSLWNNRTRLASVKDFKSYLFIITRNRIFSELRKKQELMDESALEHLREPGSQPDEQLKYKEFFNQVMDAIEQLPPRKKEVFKLSRLENLSRKEIAERTGLTYGTVNQYLIDATVLIRTRLQAIAGKELMVLLVFILEGRVKNFF
ncbi:RNA polymerase sigma-70 factor (ECF subfamily) [Chitinophaga terrae (ex Kim and Jung 2007)]|uniref:RNA polymerase sigma factor n=1 Tax=Chitinophaga terrae (ex Kim and Jung 2007) TaxID=408074 RepID=UPI00277EBCE7|nr:sigma-70 family RNA polymerase sigma factor [Chitinophaga terrae (ex Kim and Jung 2007)]MDQ0109018.1 RNA polymerase sigma-70 factor (ECF subfamily) [Chitinophaga terrae (ex Kim and Jung 2007)]